MKSNANASPVVTNLTTRGLESDRAWDYENGFYWFSHPSRINKMLAHFDLYKSIIGIPGHIFELGVFKGTSLIRLATFRAILESEYSRKIVGFDAFGKFPVDKLSLSEDIDLIKHFESIGGDGLSVDELGEIMQKKCFQNINLIKGNVFETVPKYLKENPETRIAFLHLDMDVKEPTAFALEELYSRVVPGGVIVFDDYNAVKGETDAVDEFLAQKKLRIEKLSYYNIPSFIRKPV